MNRHPPAVIDCLFDELNVLQLGAEHLIIHFILGLKSEIVPQLYVESDDRLKALSALGVERIQHKKVFNLTAFQNYSEEIATSFQIT